MTHQVHGVLWQLIVPNSAASCVFTVRQSVIVGSNFVEPLGLDCGVETRAESWLWILAVEKVEQAKDFKQTNLDGFH